MRTQTILCSLLLAAAVTARATIVVDQSWTVNQTISDGNAAGVTTSQTISGLGGAPINGVEVYFNTTGGYNGDLYGYLVLRDENGNTMSALLLNRVGTSGGDVFGSDGSGFNHIVLSDAGAVDIHDVNPGSGLAVASGTYLPDQSAGANSLNSTFSGASANGTWTLFLADLSSGDTSTLVSWGLQVSVVPEPVTYALGAFAVLLGGWALYRRKQLA